MHKDQLMSHQSCPGQTETIHRYLDGELTPVDKQTFETHLHTCQTCQVLLTELQMVFADLDSLANVAAPDDIVSKVMANLSGEAISTPAACPGQEETLYLYLDAALNPAEQEKFEPHLAHCQVCQTLLTDLQALFTELNALEDIPAPVNIADRVMADIAVTIPSPERSGLSWLVLAGQIAIGLTLLIFAQPMVTTSFDYQQLWLPWQTMLGDISRSLTTWLLELGLNLEQLLQSQWPPAIARSAGLDLPLGLALAVVAGLGLAWLVGNTMLLRTHSPTLKNGGAS
jgi:anti-sigma factor RsiW